MLVIRHPNPPFKYREVGVIVNGNTVTFPPLGPGDVQKDRQMSQLRAGLIGGLLIPGRNEFQAQEGRGLDSGRCGHDQRRVRAHVRHEGGSLWKNVRTAGSISRATATAPCGTAKPAGTAAVPTLKRTERRDLL